MSEQRLIDGNELRGIENLLNTDIIQSSKEASWLMSQVLHDIDAMPTIDPETLPIVLELREKLERVTAERDAAIVRIRQSHWCEDCKNNQIMKLCANECDCDFCGEPCYCENCHEGNLWEWRGLDGDHP